MYRMRASFYTPTTWPRKALPVLNPIMPQWDWGPVSRKLPFLRSHRAGAGRMDLVKWRLGAWRLQKRLERFRQG